MAFFDVVDSLFSRSDVTVQKFATKNSEKPSRRGGAGKCLAGKSNEYRLPENFRWCGGVYIILT